jgi:hypothetical protein
MTDKLAESEVGSGGSTWLDMTSVTVRIGCMRGNDHCNLSCVTVDWTGHEIAGKGTRNGIKLERSAGTFSLVVNGSDNSS